MKWFGWLIALIFLSGAELNAATTVVDGFEIQRDWLTMKDGVRLSVTYYVPRTSEKLPVLLELLPYRKDDLFYLRDYPLFSYFAKHGYVVAKVDVRGTGTSEGRIPSREYSDEELDDAEEIIAQLARKPWSNGRVGMWGISWGGFNAIQVAMRRPPALKAILAVDATDDLYKDDVRYIDGAFHADQYALSVENDLTLPAWPNYKLDEDYFSNRFEVYPWFLTYMKQQQDGEFWRKGSLRWNYDAIQIPVYMIGGLLDGYRDSVPRMLAHMKVPMKAEIGPWNHAWPDNGDPGPRYEWRKNLVRWWDHWLKDRDTGILDEPDFAVFVREGNAPDTSMTETPGHWRYEEWPIRRTQWVDFFPSTDQRLMGLEGLENRGAPASVDSLRYVPSSGVVAGNWWGELTGDMRRDDLGALVYDSPVLTEKIEIIGFPQIRLKVSVDAPLAHWSVRLEDVHPDGRVSLVTGAVQNGAQRDSRLQPSSLIPGKIYELDFELHFTTWTFQPGHRIRLAVSNAQFPMIWPTPYAMTTQLHIGEWATRLSLPVIPYEARPVPAFPAPEPREEREDARYLDDGGWPYLSRIFQDLLTTATTIQWRGASFFEIPGGRYQFDENTEYMTHDSDPARSSFTGDGQHLIHFADGRVLNLKTVIQVRSDEGHFHVRFTRQALENGTLTRERVWDESIPRLFQ